MHYFTVRAAGYNYPSSSARPSKPKEARFTLETGPLINLV